MDIAKVIIWKKLNLRTSTLLAKMIKYIIIFSPQCHHSDLMKFWFTLFCHNRHLTLNRSIKVILCLCGKSACTYRTLYFKIKSTRNPILFMVYEHFKHFPTGFSLVGRTLDSWSKGCVSKNPILENFARKQRFLYSWVSLTMCTNRNLDKKKKTTNTGFQRRSS